MLSASFPTRLPLPVVAYQARSIQIILIGAGGTGSWVCQHLARLVWDFNRSQALVHDEQPRRARLLVVDHDVVEQGNIKARQNFCPAEIGLPKSQLLATRYGLAFGMGPDEISAQIKPFTHSMIESRFDQLTILVGCVDNAAARQEIARCLKEYNSYAPGRERVPLVWWVDSGNGLHTGQVLIGNTARLAEMQGALQEPICTRLPSPALVHPELLTPRPDEIQEASPRLSCKELVLAGEHRAQQSRTINNHMAALVYAYVEMLIYGGLSTFATYTDLATFTVRSLEATPEAFALALARNQDFFTMSPCEELDEEDLDDEDEPPLHLAL